MSLIDEELIREQFDYLDAETVRRLLTALDDDLGRWGDRLMAAWDSGDEEALRLARHAIRGVCSNFGASSIWEMAETDLRSAPAREIYLALQGATVEAIRRIAAEAIAD